MSKSVLVTGGLGYIGSHTVVELLEDGFEVIIIDNLSNSESFMLDRIEKITGQRPLFYPYDLCDYGLVKKVFEQHKIDIVIHFAAFKSVSESVQSPLKYFQNNLISLLNVIACMKERQVPNLIFSSSATVYGIPDELPITEQSAFKKALSSYGSTKQMGEDILEKITEAGGFKTIALRYFNPVGAHASALIGELPKGIPNNLFPYVMQTASCKLPQLTVFGNDYDTPDGSCIRDYIHVVDLAKAHVYASRYLLKDNSGIFYQAFNIGTGKGTSVLEIIRAFEGCTGLKLNYVIGPRRQGDAAEIYANADLAAQRLGWEAQLDLNNMILSAWAWELSVAKDL